mmetsp:Transcript_26897/g.37539  ORF Transcript_26897/g.37539 Transcript_26897/m.37539 type:complete len:392 (+) Transcript_26897:74-1249(+)
MGCEGSRFEKTPLVPANELKSLLNEHQVEGIVLTWFESHRVSSQCAGFVDAKHEQKMSEDVWMPFGMMGQVVLASFAARRLSRRRINLNTKVEKLLLQIGSTFRIESVKGQEAWTKDLTLHHLFQHTSGLQRQQDRTTENESISDSDKAPLENGCRLLLCAKPGTVARLADTNFLLLEHIIEALEGGREGLKTSLRRYLDSGVMKDAGIWESMTKARVDSFRCSGERNSCLFNALCGTPKSLAHFLLLLGRSYAVNSHGRVKHAGSSLPMLRGIGFAKSGLGSMIFNAGPNSIMFHYTDMYGIRGLYMSCFKGPDAKEGASGFLILCKGSEGAVPVVCSVARMLLLQLNWEGVNFTKVDGSDKSSFCCTQPSKTFMLNSLKKYVMEAFTDE